MIAVSRYSKCWSLPLFLRVKPCQSEGDGTGVIVRRAMGPAPELLFLIFQLLKSSPINQHHFDDYEQRAAKKSGIREDLQGEVTRPFGRFSSFLFVSGKVYYVTQAFKYVVVFGFGFDA